MHGSWCSLPYLSLSLPHTFPNGLHEGAMHQQSHLQDLDGPVEGPGLLAHALQLLPLHRKGAPHRLHMLAGSVALRLHRPALWSPHASKDLEHRSGMALRHRLCASSACMTASLLQIAACTQ